MIYKFVKMYLYKMPKFSVDYALNLITINQTKLFMMIILRYDIIMIRYHFSLFNFR